MMGMDQLGLGDASKMGASIASILGVGISAIVLLTFAPQISGTVSAISLQGKDGGYCLSGGESLDRVVAKQTADTDANDRWALVTGTGGNTTGTQYYALAEDGTDCKVRDVSADTGTTSDLAANGTGTVAGTTYYTPQGETLASTITMTDTSGSTNAGADCGDTDVSCEEHTGEWQEQSSSLQAGGLGTLITLLFGVTGLLIPAGALGYLASVGTTLVSDKLGGGMAANVLLVVVGVVVIGAILPQIIEPLDTFFTALDGDRYYIFSQGIGKIASTISNFFGIALLAGLVSIGTMIWRNKGMRGGGYA